MNVQLSPFSECWSHRERPGVGVTVIWGLGAGELSSRVQGAPLCGRARGEVESSLLCVLGKSLNFSELQFPHLSSKRVEMHAFECF